MHFQSLSNHELVQSTLLAIKKENMQTIEVIQHLHEIYRRQIYRELGYSSLFEMAVKHFKYSPSAAQRRISTMRLIMDLPEVESFIKMGALNLSNAANLQSHFQNEKKEKKYLLQRTKARSH